MKTHIFKLILTTICFLSFSMLSAHEEPIKTLKEKNDAERKRQKIISNKVNKTIIWNVQTNNNSTPNKVKYAEIIYNNKGCKTNINLFDDKENIKATTKMVYDFENRMILDYDIEGNACEGEKTLFEYNDKGFIKKVLDINKENQLASVAEYTYIEKAKKIIFTKYSSPNHIDYTLHYVYDSDIISGNCVEIEKKDSTGQLVQKVVNIYDKSGLRTTKEIYNSQKKLEYKFTYTYTESNDFKTITKISDNGEILNTDEYFYNEKGLLIKIISKDKEGNVTGAYEYTYEFFQ